MTADELEDYLASLGLVIEKAIDGDGRAYTVASGLEIQTGGLRGMRCDVGILRTETNPYVMAAAIHTRPALVRMDGNGPLCTQASPLGSDWQYWSRRYDYAPTPKRIWAHVLTVLGDSRWEPV